ncbi:MAG TPA: N-formylglutamate amidohydrolase [Kofleriaceae bacterium]|jgi:N-formylglutamate amidohydrolase
MASPAFVISEGRGPVIATAIHAGHELRDEAQQAMVLDEAVRLREEDPFTDRIAAIAPTHIVVNRSRFEVDLNRPRESAVYMRPADAWGLDVWREPPSPALIAGSLAIYDEFYAELDRLIRAKVAAHSVAIVLDIHSYNHRRDRAPADPTTNPEINLGTRTAPRSWMPLIERFSLDLAKAGPFDVRENVKFGGGAMAAWIHRTFPVTAVALAIELKKTFMDEWTGELDAAHLSRLAHGISMTLPALEDR